MGTLSLPNVALTAVWCTFCGDSFLPQIKCTFGASVSVYNKRFMWDRSIINPPCPGSSQQQSSMVKRTKLLEGLNTQAAPVNGIVCCLFQSFNGFVTIRMSLILHTLTLHSPGSVAVDKAPLLPQYHLVSGGYCLRSVNTPNKLFIFLLSSTIPM